MKIQEQTSDRLVLRGIPQGDKGIVLAIVVGTVFIGASVLFHSWTQGAHIMERTFFVALPFVVGMAIIIGVLILLTFRERLELDLKSAQGSYCKWSILFGSRQRMEFELDRARGVSLTHRVKSCPGGQRGGPSSSQNSGSGSDHMTSTWPGSTAPAGSPG